MDYEGANAKMMMKVGPNTVQVGKFGGIANGTGRLLLYGEGSTSATFSQRVYNSSSAEIFTIRDDGYVGIGTTVPAGFFQDYRSSGGTEALFDIATSTAGILRVTSGGNVGIGLPAPTSTLAVVGSFHVQKPTSLDSSFIVTAAGNVGLGTTNPTYKLHAYGDTAGSDVTIMLWNNDNTNSASDSQLWALTGGSSGGDPQVGFTILNAIDWSIGLDNSDSDKFKISKSASLGTNDYVTIDSTGNVGIGNTAPTSTLSVTGSFHVQKTTSLDSSLFVHGTTGNVGIGTTGPGYLLDVNGTSGFRGDITGTATEINLTKSGVTLQMDPYDGSVGAIIQTTTGDKLSFGTLNGGADMTIDTAGNVGIGTTAPGGKLEVGGSITGADYGFGMYNSVAVTAPTQHAYGYYSHPTLIPSTTGKSAYEIATGAVITAGTGLTLPQAVGAYIGAQTKSGSGTVTAAYGLYVADPTIGSTNVSAYFQGNVGIGTTGPGYKLEISDATSPGLGITTAGSHTANPTITLIDPSGIAGKIWLSNAGGDLYIDNTWANNDADIYLRTQNGAVDAVTIKGSGNVGIGTTGPSSLLTLYSTGTPQLEFTTDGGDNSLIYFDDGTTNEWHIGRLEAGNKFTISESGVDNWLTIIPGGNVGIGTTGPGTLLHLQSSLTSDLTLENTGDDNPLIWLDGDVSAADAFVGAIGGKWNGNITSYIALEAGDDTTNKDEGLISFWTRDSGDASPQERVRIEQNGNVGIGTTGPNSKLTVSGTANFGGADDGVYLSYGTGYGEIVGLDLPKASYNALQFRTGATASMAITTAGNVGIGNTGPTSTLAVTGSFNVQKATALNSLLYVNSSTGNVGIGVTTPGDTLEVFGSVGIRQRNANILNIIDDGTVAAGSIALSAHDSTGADTVYALVQGIITDTTNNEEDGALAFYTTLAGANAEKVRIANDGNLGVGDTTPVEAKLVVGEAGAGNIYATFATANTETLCWDASGASLITDCSSLSKFKENVVDLSLPALETLMRLKPREYDWIGKEEGIRHDLGFVAEEVNEISPLLASYNYDNEGTLLLNGVKYERMSALLVKGIQELDAKVMKWVADQGQWDLDSDGYVVIDKLKVNEVKVAGEGTEATIGSFQFKTGELSVTVPNKRVEKTSKIFLSPHGDLNGKSWYVADQIEGVGFIVKLSGSPFEPIVFDYWIVQSADERGFY